MSRSRAVRIGAAAVVVLVAIVATVLVVRGREPMRRLVANFDRTVGLYKGSDVRVLGVKIGEVTSIVPAGTQVRVEMVYSARHLIPADAQAVLVPPTIVSDRYVQLTPAYTGGPVLPDNANLSMERTGAPLETDEVYRALSEFTAALGPGGANASGAFSDLIRIARQNLEGNGANLHATIDGLAKVLDAFADGRQDLFTTLVNLQQFTTLLAQSDQQLRSLNTRLAEVAGQLAADRAELAAMITNLGSALNDVAGFVRDNRDALKGNIEALADVTSILVRQQQALAQILGTAPLTLNNLIRAYNAQYGNLDLRIELSTIPIPGQAGPQVCGLLAAELPPLSQPSGCGERPTTAALYDDLLGAGAPADADRTMAGILR